MAHAPLNQLVRSLHRRVEAYRLDSLPDAELLERFRSTTDPTAFETNVRRHGERVLAACHKVLADAADVEDAFQATFFVLFREAKSIRKQQSLGGWLYGVAHRLALRARARTARRRSVEARKTAREAEEAPDLSWREACAILHEELDRLPDMYRLPLILCYLDGNSRDEAAQQLGLKLDTVRGRLERGRERLRARLLRRGVTLSAGLLAAVANSVAAGGPPDYLFRATLKAATANRIPANVATLVHGAATPMTLGKFKLTAVAILTIGLISGGIGLRMHGAPPTEPHLRGKPAASAVRSVAQEEEEAVEEPEKVADRDNRPVHVTGKVVLPDGSPAAGAKLFIFDSNEWKPAPSPSTSKSGTFEFEVPPLAVGRSYRYLVATAPHLGLGCDWVGVAVANEPLKDIVLRLPKDEPICGRIVDLEGKAVAGAKVRVTDLKTGQNDTLNEFVRLWSADKEKQQQAFSTLIGKRLFAKEATAAYFSTTTEADGRFTLTGIGRDRCPQLTISAKGKASQVCLVPIRPDFKPAPGGFTGSPVLGPEFTLPLTPAILVTGVVRDADKKPLAGVRVCGQADITDITEGGYLILPDVETVTDAEGRYTLDGLPKAKKYALAADPKPGDGPTHLFVSRSDEAPGFAPITADFDLPRGVIVTGRITHRKTGKPVRGYVFYRPLWSNKWVDEHPGYESGGLAPWCSSTSTWIDADGRYRLTAVPGPGLLHVQVIGHEIEREYVVAKLAPEDDTDEIIEKDFGAMKMFKTRGQGGHFSPSNLNAYRVLRIPADAKAFTVDASVDPGVKRVVKIVDPEGKPVSGAWVLNERSYGGFSKPLAGAECTVHALDPAQPRPIYAQHSGRKLAGLIALDGKETTAMILKLEPTATVTGRVVDKDGTPLKDCRISPSYDDPEIGILLNTRDLYNTNPVLTDANGKFTFTNIPAGLAVRLDATRKGGGFLGHSTPKQKLKPGESLDLGDWKPK